MKSKTITVSMLVAAVLAVGCASPDARRASDDDRYAPVRSTESYYAVIDSIETQWAAGDAIGSAGMYRIRIRFDDRSYQTVTQSNLDGLRAGDSVRIESDRVRRY